MTLSQILVMSANMLDDADLASAISTNNYTSQVDKVQLLISCANQVSNIIATDYLHIYKTKTISSSNGLIDFSSIDTNGVINVCSVKSAGVDADFEVVNGQLKTCAGSVTIKYTAMPATYSNLTDNVSDFPNIPVRVYAYGVVAEYLFIKGNIEDAESWNIRFKSSLKGIIRGKNIIIKSRRWY